MLSLAPLGQSVFICELTTSPQETVELDHLLCWSDVREMFLHFSFIWNLKTKGSWVYCFHSRFLSTFLLLHKSCMCCCFKTAGFRDLSLSVFVKKQQQNDWLVNYKAACCVDTLVTSFPVCHLFDDPLPQYQ